MERCPFCQTTLLSAFASTCEQCGRRIQPELFINTQQVTLATKPPVLSCPACGEVMPSGARFCGKCGQVVKHQKNGEITPAVSHEVSLTAQRQEDTSEKVFSSSSVAAQSTSEREAHGHMFVSYSRKQFYFTESLALHLEKQQVETWFDVQHLAPGSDWQQSLNEGLTNCVGLILVALRAALTSTYVRNEWQAILAAKKPIYIVLFEAVQLPPELSHAAAIVDFRGNFQRALSRLTESIRTGTSYRDRLPNVNLLHFPTRLPVSLWFIMSFLWINVAVSVVLLVPVLQLLPYITLLNQEGRETLLLFIIPYLGVLLYPIYYALAFTYRLSVASYSETRVSLLLGPSALIIGNLLVFQVMDRVIHMGTATIEAQAAIITRVDYALWFVSFSLIYLLLLAVGVLAFFVIPRLDDVVRWFPPGRVPETLRQKKIADYPGLRWSEESSGVARTYRLHHVPADECIADEVRQAFRGERNLCESRGEQANVHFVILTSRTPLAWVSELAHTLSNVIYITASSIRIPRDEERLRHSQWIDYRLRQQDQLVHARILLCGPSSRASIYTHPAIPESLEKLVAPQKISGFCNSLNSIGSIALATGIASLVLLSQHSQQTLPGFLLSSVALLSGCFLIWLSDRIKTWGISFIALLIALGPALVGFLTSRAAELVFPAYGIGTEIILLIGLLIVFAYARQVLGDWLPNRMSPSFQWKATLTIPFWKREWHIRVLYILGVIELILVILLRAASVTL